MDNGRNSRRALLDTRYRSSRPHKSIQHPFGYLLTPTEDSLKPNYGYLLLLLNGFTVLFLISIFANYGFVNNIFELCGKYRRGLAQDAD